MTLWKPALGLGLAFALTACDAPTMTAPGAYGAGAPVASRAARTPGTLSEVDIVRAVMSSL